MFDQRKTVLLTCLMIVLKEKSDSMSDPLRETGEDNSRTDYLPNSLFKTDMNKVEY